MNKEFEKFVKNVKKLENYYILRQEEDHILIGINIKIMDYKLTESTFQSYSSVTPKVFPVFFLATGAKKATELEKLCIEKEVPIFSIHTTTKEEDIRITEDKLGTFVKARFLYEKHAMLK